MQSYKLLFDLPYATHRYFYEEVTGSQHPALIIRKRFLGFLKMIEQSKKKAALKLLQIIRNDVRTITGSNIRKILLEFNEQCLENVKIDQKLKMFPVPTAEQWRVGFVNEILFSKNESFKATDNEITDEISNEVLNYLCFLIYDIY